MADAGFVETSLESWRGAIGLLARSWEVDSELGAPSRRGRAARHQDKARLDPGLLGDQLVVMEDLQQAIQPLPHLDATGMPGTPARARAGSGSSGPAR